MLLSKKNCLLNCLSTSCLLFVLGLVIALIFLNKHFKFLESKVPDVPVARILKTRVIFISDSESDWSSSEYFMKRLKSMDPKPAAVIHSGDITHLGVLEDLKKSKDIFTSSDIPFYFIPGDRDLWKTSGIKNFNETFGNSYQVVNIEGVKFLLIDNSDEYKGIPQEEASFISDNVKDSTFAVFHNPIYFNKSILGVMKKGMGQYSSEVDAQRQILLQMIRDSDIKATFSGDQHFFSKNPDEESAGLEHFVVGALTSERNLEEPNFLVLDIYSDGTYEASQNFLVQ